jgi:cytoskeletal protein CcmA (bactofilin family)
MFRKSTDTTSLISRGVTVVGEIFSDGTVRLFGRIKGDVRASTVLIEEGAEVEGDLGAEELTIAGRVKGTIHATRVKLAKTGVVQGDIVHRSLSIDPNARFEGLSKREDDATDDMLRCGKSLRSPQAPARAADAALTLAATMGKPAAHDVSLTIAEAGAALRRSSGDEEDITPVDAMDRVQRALNVVAALGGGSRLADLSLTSPAAEPRSKNGSVSSAPITSPAAVPSEPEPDNAD